MPILFTCSINSFSLRATFVLGIDSSLSSVPPVCPRPRPDILATLAPQAATIGKSTKEVLSPTPPVECLSTFTPSIPERSTISPLWYMALVKSKISRSSIPLNMMAISKALD